MHDKLLRRQGTMPLTYSRKKAFNLAFDGHRLTYHPGGSTLIVSFDNAARPFEGPFDTREIWGEKFYRGEGHSLLGVVARKPDWFRCADLISGLKALSESSFFQEFDRVVLTGGSMGAFAACAFAPLVPGCTVLAVSPQVSVDPRVVPWETRFPKAIKQDWNLPFSSATEGLEAAGPVYVVFDPLDRRDRTHVRMFPALPNVIPLPIPSAGHDVSVLLHQLEILKPYTRAAIDGTLSPTLFRKMISARKSGLRYRRILFRHAMHRGRYKLAVRVAELSQADFPQGNFQAMRIAALTASGRLPEAMKQIFPHDADNNLLGEFDPIKPKPVLSSKKVNVLSSSTPHRFDKQFPNLRRNIFLITYGRSGSTLLQNLLMTLPGCHLRGENHNVIEPIWNAVGRCRLAKNVWGKDHQPADHPWFGADEMKPMLFARGMIDSMVHTVLCPPSNCRYFGFKEIRYNVFGDRLPEVLEFMRFHFKDPLFVFNTRNVEDVAKSAWWKEWKQEDVKSLIHAMDRRFAEYHAAHPEHSMMLSYEQFSQDPLALKPLFDRLEEPFDQGRIEAVLANRLTH